MVLTNAYIGFGSPPRFFAGVQNGSFGQDFQQDSQMVAYYFITGSNVGITDSQTISTPNSQGWVE